MPYRSGLSLAAILALSIGWQVSAYAEPGEIKGQDVKGDREKSANDGWSQAPVPREESAAKDAANPGGQSTSENAERPVEKSGSADNSSKDPAQTLDHRTPAPSGENPAQPSK